jgi:L-amino acid N-acyltransferase YncA
MATIRIMRTDDLRTLRQMVLGYLKETYAGGGEYPPTLENAAVFLKYGMDGAACGDPCLVAVDEHDRPVGYCIVRSADIPGTTSRNRTARSWGTYVCPGFRNTSLATALFRVACRMAQAAGYTRLIAMTYGTAYEEHTEAVLRHLTDIRVIGRVVVSDLAPPQIAAADVPSTPPDSVSAS